METKEAILATISEFSNKIEPSEDTKQSEALESADEGEHKNIFIDIKEKSEVEMISDEMTLLLGLKEKSLVLFEGLRNTQKEDLEMKLEMVMGYLEYQLYVIEDRLKNLQEEEK